MDGIATSRIPDNLGLFINRAYFREACETAVEFTWRFEVCSNLAIQPSCHYIVTGDRQAMIGLLRIVLRFG